MENLHFDQTIETVSSLGSLLSSSVTKLHFNTFECRSS